MVFVKDSRLRFIQKGQRSHVTTTGSQAIFNCDQFEVEGEIDLQGAATDTGAGYRLGFTQLQWIETNRATYAGLVKGDGASEVKRDRPPARPAQACRDVESATDPFTYPPNAQALQGYTPQNKLNVDLSAILALPATVDVSHADAPQETYPLQRVNARTGKPNYLSWVQIEFHFCSVLMVRRQDGTFHQLQHFYWNVHWNVNFTAQPGAGGTGATVSALPPSPNDNAMHFGPFTPGAATDGRFSSLIAAPVVTTCNTVADQEARNAIVTESVK